MSLYEFPYPAADLAAEYPFVQLEFELHPHDEMRRRAAEFHGLIERRRSVRMLSDEAVPLDLSETAIRTASTAPSGAHHQPWQFVAIGGYGGQAPCP